MSSFRSLDKDFSNQDWFVDDFGTEDLTWDDFTYEGEVPERSEESMVAPPAPQSPEHAWLDARLTRIKIDQLYTKVQKTDLPEEKELLAILDEAREGLKGVTRQGGKSEKIQEALWIYDEVDHLLGGGENASSESAWGDEGMEPSSGDEKILNPRYQDEDSPVSEVDAKAGKAVYRSNPEVVLHHLAAKDGIQTYVIQDATTFTLYPAAASDRFVVSYDKASNQYKIVNGDKSYLVDPIHLEKITLMSTQVDTTALSAEQREHVQVGADEAADEELKRLDIIKTVAWPEGGITSHVDCTNTNSSHAGGGGSRAQEICEKLDEAMRTKNWEGVAQYIRENSTHDWNAGWTQYNDEYMNDAVRKIVTGIFRASGGKDAHDPKFMGMLKLLPEDVRYALRDGVLHHNGELHETHGDQWDSQATADLLDASLKSETGSPAESGSAGA